jgi:MFS family permease
VRPDDKLAGSFDISAIVKVARNGKVKLALLGITLYGSGYGIFLTTLPAWLLREKAFNADHIGIFFSLFYVAISISQIITGRLCGKFGSAVFMVCGLAAASIGLYAVRMANSSGLFAALAAASLGLGVFYIASMIFLNETVDETLKGTISGAYYLFWGIGMFFGPPALSAASAFIGYDTTLTAYASLFMAMAAIMLLKLKPTMKRNRI